MPAQKPLYTPELKEGATWLVEWYAESGGKRTRIRHSTTYAGVELNSIPDLKERRRIALEFLAEAKKRLKPGKLEPQHTRFVEALATAVELKASPKASTMRTYGSVAKFVVDFFKGKGWEFLSCEQVTLLHVQAYFDHLVLVRKVGNTTHNNHKNALRALLTELVQRAYFASNLASQIRYRVQQDTTRRPMSEHEEEAVVEAIRNDKAMLFAYIVQRYLGVRPDETRHLRVGQFDFVQGLLVFPGRDSKNNRNSAVTIPQELVPALQALDFDRYPKTHFVLGGNRSGRANPGMRPAATMIGKNTMGEKWRQLFARLAKSGRIGDATGLCFYSLKDTLAVYMLDNGVDVESAMRHLRQRDLETFQRYVKRLGLVNEKIRAMPVRVKW